MGDESTAASDLGLTAEQVADQTARLIGPDAELEQPSQDQDAAIDGDEPDQDHNAPAPGLHREKPAVRARVGEVVDLARRQLGIGEDPPGSNRNKFTSWYGTPTAWCAIFVRWNFVNPEGFPSGWSDSELNPNSAYCPAVAKWYQQQRQWIRIGHGAPRPGDQVFFDWTRGRSGSGYNHTGLVEAVHADGTVTTIEGNWSDGVRRVRRTSYYIVGFGRPTYDDSTPVPPEPTHPARYKVKIAGLEYGYGAAGSQVAELGKALVAKGFGKHYTNGPGPRWTDADTENYSDFQKSLGLSGRDADGVPGPDSLKKLLGHLPTITPKRPDHIVDLAQLVSAAEQDPARKQGGTTPGSADDVRLVEDALHREGLLAQTYAGDGSFGSTTVQAYRKWQLRCGYSGKDADGIPGKDSLTRLGKKYGFTVK
ncbi:CHAP domain-containing protein [Actinopolymorpha singaporensis]|uniref:CHAP domain-containing protein n=1 Tax=Actinopolymorpha singaporensis TaxID=117157 RepID=A0A1H1MUA8_9ACTN|nr:CHAP domain-containing protein [Actinopolymorpha singaporensis]